MPDTQRLHVALQDGFYQDSVQVTVDGKEVATRTDVTTKPQVGMAGVIDVSLPAGKVSLCVSVQGKQPSEALTIDLTQPVYIGVSIGSAGQIVYTQSEKPFRYA
jgi:hypothetical protein